MVGKVDQVRKNVNPEFLGAIRLLHRRWSVPVVGVLHRDGPQRFGGLAGQLRQASRDTLTETLRELEAAGVIRHDADIYGLTPQGTLLGDAALGAIAAVQSEEILGIALKKWPMMVMTAVGRGCSRFNEVKARVPGLTSGALAPALKDLERAGLVERRVADGYPPPVTYALTARGERVFPAMDQMVRAADGGKELGPGCARMGGGETHDGHPGNPPFPV
ncbi:MAG: winged helix-turn-helix transcriptional regulator [Dehalococcoidia bacterium]